MLTIDVLSSAVWVDSKLCHRRFISAMHVWDMHCQVSILYQPRSKGYRWPCGCYRV